LDATGRGAKSLAEATATEAGTLVADFAAPIAMPLIIVLGLVAIIVVSGKK